MSLEQWKTVFEVGTVVLLFFTFVFGAGVLFTGTRINARQAERLRVFDKQLTDARTELGKQQVRAANAEHDAAEAKNAAANVSERAQILEANAADAKAAQQRVELELSQQREKTANAERDLLEVRKRQEPRNLFSEDVEKLKAFLANKQKSPVIISCVYGNREACTFAEQIKNVLVTCGWNVTGVIAKPLDGSPSGISLLIPSGNKNVPTLPNRIPIAATVLLDTFREVLGINLDRRFPILMSLPSDTVELLIGYQ